MSFRSILIASVALFSVAFADYGQGQSQSDQGALCPKYGTNRDGSMYTEGYGPFVYGDFLYWTSQIDGLDLAFRQQTVTQPSGTFGSSLVRIDFEWDPAFRVGIGHYFDFDGLVPLP